MIPLEQACSHDFKLFMVQGKRGKMIVAELNFKLSRNLLNSLAVLDFSTFGYSNHFLLIDRHSQVAYWPCELRLNPHMQRVIYDIVTNMDQSA